MRRSVPPPVRRTRHRARGSVAEVTAAIVGAESTSPPPSSPMASAPPGDAMSFLAELLDLRSSVALERVLDAGQAPFEDHPLPPTARHAAERALTAIDGLEHAISAISFCALPRAKSLSAGSILGTLRGTLRDEGDELVASASGIERAARTLWSPFNSFLVQQVTRAHGEIDDAVGLAGGALTASSPRAQRLFALHDALERTLGTRRATLFDVPTRALGAAFADALGVAVEALPHPCTEADVAPWLEDGGLFPKHFELAEALLRALVRHRAEPARAMLVAVGRDEPGETRT